VAVIAIEISQAYQELPSITTLAYPSVVTTFTTPIVSPDYYAGAIDLITCYNGGVPAGTKGSSQTTLSAGFNASSSAVGYSSLRSLTNGVYFDMQWSMGYGIVMAHAILLVREARDDALLFGAGF
jgi:hypothetical protein